MTDRHRNNPIRASILNFLRSSANHPTPEKIHTAIRQHHPSTSFATVHRNLNILVDLNLTEELESSREPERFDAQAFHHSHFRCDDCGKPHDFPLAPASLFKELYADYGHHASKLNFYGVCAGCKT